MPVIRTESGAQSEFVHLHNTAAANRERIAAEAAASYRRATPISSETRLTTQRLYEEYNPTLVNFLTYLGASADSVQSVANDTFIKIMNKLNQGNSFHQDTEKGWVLEIGKNALIDDFRRDKVHKKHEVSSLEAEEELGHDASSPDFSEDYVEVAVIKNIIAGMPAIYGRTIVLKCLADLSYKEITEFTGLSKEVVSTRLNRARKMFKNEYYKSLKSDAA